MTDRTRPPRQPGRVRSSGGQDPVGAGAIDQVA